MECYSCRSLSGEKRISPGPPVFEGKHWVVEHAYPSGLEGWLVLVLKRHAEALHELGPEEFQEMGELQEKCAKALRSLLHCEKEYVVCFAEAEGFHHVHVHVIPRHAGLPHERIAARIFSYLQVTPDEAVPVERVKEICKELGDLISGQRQ